MSLENVDRTAGAAGGGPAGPPPWQVALVSAGVGVAVAVALTLADRFRLPPTDPGGVVSATSIASRSPYDLYAVYAAGAGVALALATVGWGAASLLTRALNTRAALAGLLVVWVLNSSLSYQRSPFGVPAGDAFHEGEYFGFLAAFQADGLPACAVIHGPVLNIGPSVVAGPYRDDGYSIAVARAIRSGFSVVALSGFLWALWEVTLFYRTGRQVEVFLAGAVAVVLAEGVVYQTNTSVNGNYFRDVLFWPLCAALLRWMRTTMGGGTEPVRLGKHAAAGAVIGAISVAHLFVSYERSLHIPLIILVILSLATAAAGYRKTLPFGLGLAAGGGGTALLIGPANFSPVLTDLQYWSRYGGWLFNIPVAKETLLYNRLFITQSLIVFATIVLVVRGMWAQRRELRRWAADVAPVIVALAVAVLTARRFLARADEAHFALAGLPVMLLAAAAVLWLARARPADARGWPSETSPFSVAEWGSAMICVACLLYPRCNPAQLARYPLDWERNERKVTETSRRVAAAIRTHTGAAAPPSIYTLDSNGTWYYLIGARSPSRFHQAWYAMPPDSQRAVVADLRRDHTAVVLVAPDLKTYDGLTSESILGILHDYLRQHYKLADRVDGWDIYVIGD